MGILPDRCPRTRRAPLKQLMRQPPCCIRQTLRPFPVIVEATVSTGLQPISSSAPVDRSYYFRGLIRRFKKSVPCDGAAALGTASVLLSRDPAMRGRSRLFAPVLSVEWES